MEALNFYSSNSENSEIRKMGVATTGITIIVFLLIVLFLISRAK